MFEFLIGLVAGLLLGAGIVDCIWRYASWRPRDEKGRFEKKT